MKSAFVLITYTLITASVLPAAEPHITLSDLSEENRLIFTAEAGPPGQESYRTLFSSDLSDNDEIQTCTFYPERSRYFPATAELEIQNRFGLYRIAVDSSEKIRQLDFHPSYIRDAEISAGRILPVSSSPDGKWILEQEPDGPVKGRLVLYRSSGGAGIEICSNQVLEYRDSPALWSPDSRYFLYTRNGILYYVSTRQLENGRLPDESYREFGEGELSSVRWTGSDALYYLKESELRLVRPSEIFTSSFYDEPLPVGSTAGILPVEFDPDFDSFWPAPGGDAVILLKGERNLFYFSLNPGESAVTLPFLLLPEESVVEELWWRSSGDIILLAGSSRRGTDAVLYRLNPLEGTFFRELKIEGINRFVPSPHRDYLALLKSSGVSLVNPETMEEVIFIDHPEPRDLFWMSPSRFLIAGSRRIELVNTDGSGRELLCLSQVEKSGFDARGKLRASSSGKIYDWDFNLRHWTSSGEGNGEVFREPVFETRENRVYLEENVIVVRTVLGFGNRRILHREETEPLSLPESADFQEEADNRILFHGSRTGKKRVALVFNAPEGNEGLNDVLRTLKDYSLRVTFFIGGDFIRRNPESTRILAESGHETGSLFYTCIDLTDIRYRIDKNFIVRGLGRNEDSFFRETGSEVSTIWHAPWYVISPSILEATEDMNYLYIGRDVDSRDRPVPGDSQRHVPELIESILERVQPGSIIPVQIGRSGEREDYLFQNLDLLINGLLNEGYEIVTVHELREPDR